MVTAAASLPAAGGSPASGVLTTTQICGLADRIKDPRYRPARHLARPPRYKWSLIVSGPCHWIGADTTLRQPAKCKICPRPDSANA